MLIIYIYDMLLKHIADSPNFHDLMIIRIIRIHMYINIIYIY